MRITITSTFVRNRIPEGSAASFAVKVYDDATDVWSLSVPTSLQYRVDNPATGTQITDWTTVSADDEVTITLNGSAQLLSDQCNPEEPRQITVRANTGLSTQCQQSYRWAVVNAFGTQAA